MKDEDGTPMMLRFLFGEAPGGEARGTLASPAWAPERLMRWAEAYEAWLAERKERYGASTIKQSKLAWRRLLQQRLPEERQRLPGERERQRLPGERQRLPGERQRLPGERQLVPWELTQADIEGHAAWMQAQGYSPATIGNALGIIANFYKWCEARRIDPECEAGFNPAEKVQRPKVERYREAKLLSREEVDRLLRTMRHDRSELGRREYAFGLARLRLGVPLRHLQRLRWGQIEQDAEGAGVRWEAGGRSQLPEDVFVAIADYLEAAGRMEGMRAESFIFAPLADPLRREASGKATDWAEGRPLSSDQLLQNLKLYGRLAGIGEEKLTLMALRRTAMRLRLEEGTALGEMRAFLDSQEAARSMKYRLGKLPELPKGKEGQEEADEEEVRRPVRKGTPFQPGEGAKHWFYAHSQPPEAVAAVLRENIQGMEEEIVGLRILGRGMLERQGQARSRQETALLGEAYSLTAFRLGQVIKVDNELAERRKSSQWAKELLEVLDQIRIEGGEDAISEAGRAEGHGNKPELEAGARRVVEEIAAMRYCLRNAFRLALATEETREHIRYAEIYSSGCMRLAKLLRMEMGKEDQLERELNEAIDQATEEISKDWVKVI